MLLEDKKLLVIGMARSGISGAIFAKSKGADVTVYDAKSKELLQETIEKLKGHSIKVLCGSSQVDISPYDLLVLSPGVPTDLEFIEKARQEGKPVIAEVELAYAFCRGKIIGITGTNGKTTTTALVGHIMQSYNRGNKVVGNIGIPFTGKVDAISSDDYAIAELSSFQLESIIDFKCDIAAVLNITPDHLNRHKTMKNYIDAKKRIFENQDSSCITILNADDEETYNMADDIPGGVMFFSYDKVLFKGVYRQEGNIILLMPGMEKTVICSTDDMKIFGRHNVENAMAAIAICYQAGIPVAHIRKQLLTFKGVEHRGEYVDTIDGVPYYNDSKATNPDAAIKGLGSMKWPTILIGGGMDKNSDFSSWIELFDKQVKHFIVFGETSDQLIADTNKLGFTMVTKVANLQEAVALSNKLAESGDCVLLSPACASWDMFSSYEERGDLFKELVDNLKE